MRILVVGHRGMLGTDLMAIAGEGHESLGADIDEVDIADLDSTRSLVRSLRPEAVINAAAYTDVDGCETDETLAFSVNAEGPKNLAIACRETPCSLYHLSTDYVFDGRCSDPYVEAERPNPISIYGRSKHRGEELLAKETDRFAIIRTSWLYGPGGQNFPATMLRLAEEKDELSVVDDQEGSPTYTVDLANAILALVERSCRGIFHVTNSGSCTWYGFACWLLSEAGITGVTVNPVTTSEFPRPAPRPAHSVLDTAKFSRTTGMKMRKWEDALGEFLRRIGKMENSDSYRKGLS